MAAGKPGSIGTITCKRDWISGHNAVWARKGEKYSVESKHMNGLLFWSDNGLKWIFTDLFPKYFESKREYKGD